MFGENGERDRLRAGIPVSTVITNIGFSPPQKIQSDKKTSVTAAVTPVSYPFEPVIAASKQLLYGVRLKALFLFVCVRITLRC